MTKKPLLIIFTMILQLVWSPVASATTDCPEGQYFNPSTGRCLLTTQTANVINHTNRCANLSGEELRECYANNVREEIATLEGKHGLAQHEDGIKKGNLHRYGVPVMVSFIAGYYLLKKKNTFQNCKSGSMWFLLGGAVAGMGTEIYAQLNYSRELKSILEDYEAGIAAYEEDRGDENDGVEQANEAQTLALEYMKKQEEARRSAEDARKKGHMLAGGLYATAAILGIVEQVQLGSMGSCVSSTPAEASIDLRNMFLDKDFANEFSEYSYLKTVSIEEFFELVKRKIYNNLFINTAFAQEPSDFVEGLCDSFTADGECVVKIQGITVTAERTPFPEPELAGVPQWTPPQPSLKKVEAIEFNPPDPTEVLEEEVQTPLGQETTRWVDKAIGVPLVRSALAGILTGYAAWLVDKAKDNIKIADERIEAIDDILISFRESAPGYNTACTEEQRANPGVPACFCYKEDGSVNQQRINRVTCKAYMSDKTPVASRYGGKRGSGYAPVKACLRDEGQVEEDCKVCEKAPARCHALQAAQMGTINVGGTQGVGDMVGQYNALATGQMSAADLDAARLGNQNAVLNKTREKMSKKEPYRKVANKIKKMEEAFLKAAPALYKKSYGNNPPKLASLSPFNPGSNSPTLSGTDGEEKNVVETSSKGSEAKTAGGNVKLPKNKNEDFDFGFGGDSQGGVVVEESGDIMDKNFAITGDIHKNPDNNIFQILSLRYQRSGLRRLFDAEGRSKADAPADTDISEK